MNKAEIQYHTKQKLAGYGGKEMVEDSCLPLLCLFFFFSFVLLEKARSNVYYSIIDRYANRKV